MFTLDKKYLVRNGAAAVFLLVFALIYEHFSHGVISGYPYLDIKWLRQRQAAENGEQRCAAASGLWQLGIFTLSQGFIMKGIIEIYGTTNRWTAVYIPAAVLLFIAAAGVAMGKRKGPRGDRSVPSEDHSGSFMERAPGKQSGALHPPGREG